MLSKFRAFVMNGFDLGFGIVRGKSMKEPLITKTRRDEITKEDGVGCFRGEAVSF